MALTRAQVKEILSSAGVSSENMDSAVDKIINGHITTVDALKEERDEYKKLADRLPAIEKERDDLKSKNADDWKKKYETEHSDFETYKKGIADKEAEQVKIKLFTDQVLKPANIDPRRYQSILRLTDLSKISVEDNAIKDAESHIGSVKKEWEDYIVQSNEQKHSQPATPPPSNGSTSGISRAAQLEKQYAENLYGKGKD